MTVEELKADELRACCDPSMFEFESTEEVDLVDGVISQERAVRSIEFALGIRGKGFNIYVAGPIGTGKATIVKRFVERFSESGEVPDDWLFVNNFKDPDRPLAVNLHPGEGCGFKRDMMELVRRLERDLPGQFESDRYRDRNRALVEKYVDRKKALVSRIEGEAKEKGFQIKSTPAGIVTLPLVDDEPVKGEDYLNLREDLREEIETKQKELNAAIQDVMREVSRLDRSAREEVEKLNREVALFAVGHHIDEMKDRYRDHPKIMGYLDDVREDILDHLGDFLQTSGEDAVEVPGLKVPDQPSPLTRYEVNVLVDNRYTKGAPVIFETNPTYSNLVGQIERKARFGTYTTDFTMIKAGSILKANGGYLIVNAEDVLRNAQSYEAIKRVLKNDEIKIEEIGDSVRLVSAGGPKPEPIPVKVKVVMIGSPYYFRALYGYDEEFRKIFKVRADFSDLMARDEKSVREYARFIATLCRGEGLRHFTPEGVAAVVDFGTRLVADQRKLSLRFGDIADVVREANYWTGQGGDGRVGAESVRRAVEEKEYRSNLLEERIGELIEEGTIMVDVGGEVIGQVNGLSIYDLGDFSFGKPSRITVQTYVGKEGVVNIERKVELSGSSHDKGVLILSGYLAGRYADTKPLSLSASVCFEQSYDMIDGDSASSTELFAILSALAEVPIRQGIAVTGSVNQRGWIQPIGGVNQKIEGFFDVCRAKGLTGAQGVIIPRSNVKNLMLRDAVVDAVREGRFHIWPIENVDEGIEVLTGVPAGERDAEGYFPDESINGLVMRRLDEMAEGYRAYSSGYEDGEEGDGGEA